MSFTALSVLGVLCILGLGFTALLLAILWPRRHPFSDAASKSVDTDNPMQNAALATLHPVQEIAFEIPSGGTIAARRIGPPDARDIILLVHGIAVAGSQWIKPANLLSETTGTAVIAIDLRGHGASSGKPYDLDWIGQYEDDVTAIITQIEQDQPGVRIWVAGHSMGGGIALRLALKEDRPRVAGYILLAPIFGPGPTTPPKPQLDGAIRMDHIRMTALIVFNLMRIRIFNHLPVAYVKVPPDFPAYSFAALASGLPLPPKTAADGLAAMEGPCLILAGTDDAAVRPQGYREVATPFGHCTVELFAGHDHDSILDAHEIYEVIAAWMAAQVGS